MKTDLFPWRGSLPPRWALPLLGLAVVSFHLAYEVPALAALMVVFLLCLFPLAEVATGRQAFYTGLLLGGLIYGPQLAFFYQIFGVFAVALYFLLALNPALFLFLAHHALKVFPRWLGLLMVPVLWTGIEYFRCELWYLRFAWLTPGLAFSGVYWMGWLGFYGATFAVLLALAVLWMLPRKVMIPIVVVVPALMTILTPVSVSAPRYGPFVTGIQLEGASEGEVTHALDEALRKYPQSDLFVLSEYTFATPPPASIVGWCAKQRKFVVVGGMEPEGDGSDRFRNTAYVIDSHGQEVFSQGKAVPIQFMQDGLPAKSQALWQSPWGKIGICICYDLSYTRVTDELVRQGAKGLIVPTMDVENWGLHEHLLHARIAPARAVEYGIPIFRVCSSGISELVDASGRVFASGTYPGAGEVIGGHFPLQGTGELPVDRVLAPACVGGVGILIIFMLGATWILRRRSRDLSV